jgi:hypothetical protein
LVSLVARARFNPLQLRWFPLSFVARVGRIVAVVLAIVAVVLGWLEFIAADSDDLWRIMAADRMEGDLKLYWRFLAAFGGVRKFNVGFL